MEHGLSGRLTMCRKKQDICSFPLPLLALCGDFYWCKCLKRPSTNFIQMWTCETSQCLFMGVQVYLWNNSWEQIKCQNYGNASSKREIPFVNWQLVQVVPRLCSMIPGKVFFLDWILTQTQEDLMKEYSMSLTVIWAVRINLCGMQWSLETLPFSLQELKQFRCYIRAL